MYVVMMQLQERTHPNQKTKMTPRDSQLHALNTRVGDACSMMCLV